MTNRNGKAKYKTNSLENASHRKDRVKFGARAGVGGGVGGSLAAIKPDTFDLVVFKVMWGPFSALVSNCL